MNAEPFVFLTVAVTEEERRQLEAVALKHGYETPGDYLKALVLESLAADNDIDIEAEFKTAWKQAKRGEFVPLDSLWTDM